jgi:enoyl reductase-like protein/acyl dehydratase
LPLIGILGLADFCIACKILGKTPGEFGSLLRGVTGHSHGIVVATAVAIADSWESFYKVARLVVDILFWTGVESYRNAPRGAIPTSTIHGSVEKGYGQPSPMLSVRGLNQGQIEALIEQFNGGCHSEEKLYLSLANARDNFVVAGPASALVHFNSFLEARKADDTDQARVPFSKRKPVIVHQFLPISAPFHTPYLREAAARVKEALSGLTITAESLRIPVYHSRTGQDLVDLTTSNLVEVLVDALMCDPCNWPAAITFSGASHIVAFGRGIGELVRQIKDGCGVRVILGSALESRHKDIGTRANLFSPRWLPASTCVDSWAKKFQPRLALSATGGLQLETRLTQLLGTPPVMVAGMIPTTAHWDFVSAVMNAGYHIELAGGGYHCAADMSTAINELVASVPAARGVTCNLIYANPQALAWQIALLRQLSQKGFPVDGLTIGAGVPAPEVVAEYISSLSLRHIGFRPGSVAAIQQVIKIAQLCPDFPIILQWTGGRAGGHHSLEDFHLSILKSYSAIRKCQNIILVAGSGFGGGDEYQYLSGSWSSALGYAPMPFDGILLGSRMMAVREAHTSPAVKKCIVAQYSHKEEESAKDVLDGISRALVERFQQEHDPSLSICSFDSGAMVPNSSSSSDGPHPLTVPTDPLMSSLRSAEEPPNWTSVFVNGAHTIQGRERRQNPFPRILQLRPGDSLTIDQENQTVVSTTKVESGTVVTAKMVCQNGVDISVELHQPSAFHQEPVILPLQYRFDPGNTSCRLSEAMEGRNDRIKSFYSQLWFGEDVNPDLNLQSVFRGPEMRLTSNLLHNLLSTVNQSYTTHENMFINSDEFPISAGIIIAREVLLKPLTLNDVDGDLLRLVHESYDFGYYNGANPLRVGDIVTSKSRVKALHIKDSGKQLVVEAIIERQGQPVMRVTSSFLFRGSFDDFGSTFQHKIEPDRILEVTSVQEEAILRARKWFVLKDTSFSLVGKTLLFKLETNLSWKNALEYQSLAVHGSVYAKQSNGELVKVGAIQLSCGECVGNPVVDFLERKGLLTTPESDPKSPGWSGASSLELQIPSSNERYARVSGDFNPIHVSNIFASWAGLPGTITHSMYTSAVSAGVLEHLAADGQFSRVRRWKASFTGMVLPSDTLSVKLQHTGMRDGRMVFRVSAKKHDTDKIVLDAEAELEQPQTAYIFTDQGSQVQGMGMGLYKSCPVAKAIWEKVDQQFKSPTVSFTQPLI